MKVIPLLIGLNLSKGHLLRIRGSHCTILIDQIGSLLLIFLAQEEGEI